MDSSDNRTAHSSGCKMYSWMTKIMSRFINLCKEVPVAGWLLGLLASVCVEYFAGNELANILGMDKIPVLFGLLTVFKDPLMIPNILGYALLIYFIPVLITAIIIRGPANKLAALLDQMPIFISGFVHVCFLYSIIHFWTGMNDYHLIVMKITLISVILTLSLNVINGYMGEFSCSHPGFMAVGAYTTSVMTLILFTKSKFGIGPFLPEAAGPLVFPLVLIAGGLLTSLTSLIVAIPSFRTRGDYLAIISLAFTFMIKSIIENLEIIGGPRGLGDQPDFSGLPVVFAWTVICIWVVNNFISSVPGLALNAVRDNEGAADAMTVNTRKTKIITFMFGAFWAGVAGGLLAHMLRYINPGTFGLQKLAEIFAMVYFGGLNSIYGSIMGASSISLLGEILRPLELYKWIVIPLLLIIVMIKRPKGLMAFRRFNIKKLLKPRNNRKEDDPVG
jgi:branched-chain amino acid transport system permease protein